MFVKKFRKVVKIISVSFAVLSAITACIACDIGLGGAVDTEAPTGSITSPGDDAVIRDAFAIKGSWHDDGSVGKITVNFRNTKTNSINTYNADVSSDGTWLCAVNPSDSNQSLPDGNYVATVTLYDNGGHTANLTRSYTVDNTPPVVILQRPSTIITDSDTDTYGQKFTLQGQAADDNNINKIDVNVYSDSACTNFLKTISLNNVPASINLDVATFSESIDNDYSVIYGHTTKSGSEIRYCKILAYDGAQRYPVDGSNQSAEDTNGNCQTEYYLYDEISSTVLSAFKVNEIYSVFNGTYATSDSARALSTSNENIAAVKEALNGKQKSAGKFALNPANNPKFTVSGKNTLKKDGGDFYKDEYTISTGNEVVVEVSTGLDGITLDEDSLKVYFVECDAYGNKKDEVRYYPVTERSTSGSSRKFKTPIAAGLKSSDGKNEMTLGRTYIFGVEGTDTSGNAVEPNENGYGFYLAASGAAPTLETHFYTSENGTSWTEKTDTVMYLKAGTYVKVKGSVTVEEGRPEFSITLNGHDGNTTEQWLGAEKAGSPFTYTFEKIYDKDEFGTESKQHSIIVSASQSRRTSSKAYTVLYDMEGPVVTLSEITPVAANYYNAAGELNEDGTTDGKSYLNGKNVSIRISISDAYDVVDSTTNPAKIEILDSTEAVRDGSGPIATPANFTWKNIDTTKITDGPITIRVTAYDRAGNKTEQDFTGYEVKQSTDNPVILPNSPSQLSFKLTDKTQLTTSQNKFSSGSQLLLKLIDDDGGVTITPYLNETSGTPETFTSANTTYTYNLPTGAGYYNLRFLIADSVTPQNSKWFPKTGTFVIKIIAGAPTIEEIQSEVKDKDGNKKDTLYTRGKSEDTENYFVNTITFDSEYKKVNIYRTSTVDANGTPVFGTGSLIEEQYDLTPGTKVNNYYVYQDNSKLRPAGTTTYYYKVGGVDEDDSTGTVIDSNVKKIVCRVDLEKPTIILGSLPGKADTAAAAYTFSGNSGDTGGSGVEKVEVTITDASGHTNTVTAENTTSWACKVEYAGTDFKDVFEEEGTKTISVKAVDAAGNESVSLEQNFLYDKNSPKIEEIKVGNDTTKTDFVSGYMPSTGYNLSLKATDSYQLKNFVVKQVFTPKTGTSVTKDYEFYTGTDSEKEKTLKIPFNPDNPEDSTYTPHEGTYTYLFTVTDQKGNEVSSQTFECIVDLTPPVVTINNQNYKGQNAISKTSFPFDGDIVETNSMSGVYYAIVNSEGKLLTDPAKEPVCPTSNVLFETVWKSNGFTLADSAGTTAWKTTLKFSTTENLSAEPKVYKEGVDYKIIVYAVDKAGNVGNAADMTFDVDMTPPELTASTTKTIFNKDNLTGDKGSFDITGIAEDSLGLQETAAVSIEAKSKTDTKTFTIDEAAISNKIWSKTIKFGSGNSSDPDYLPDGVYTFTVTATDLVGKTKEEKLSVTIDTVKPTVGNSIKLNDKVNSSAIWYGSKSLPLEVTVTENESGIKAVKTNTTTNNPEAASWKTISLVDGTTYTFTGNIQLSNLSAEGKQNFYIMAIDNANNTSEIKSVEVQVDITAPELELKKYKIGDSFSTETFINGEKTLTVYGTYADTQSGVQPLTFTGTNVDANGKYMQPVVKYSAFSQNPENIADADWKKFDDSSLSGVKNLSWRAVFENSIISETGEIHVIGKNNVAGEALETDLKLFKLNKDTKKPELKNIKITPSLSEYSVVEKTEATGTVYYLNNTKGTFSFTGLAEDKEKVNETTGNKEQEASGVYNVSLSIGGLTTQPLPQPTAYFSGIDLSGITGSGTVATLTVKDNAGNEYQTQLTIKFDTVGPVGKHQFDKNGKDLYFRFGDQDNDVGGKYSPDTYGKLNTLKIRGKFEDALTEPAIFYYKVFDHSPDSTDLAAVKSNYENKTYSYFNGNFAPLGTPETKTVEYTNDLGSRDTASIVSNYKTTIADLQEGSNYVVILAVDKVGNPAIEEITAKDGTKYNCYKINVDQTAPKITCDETETKYTNAEADWTLSGTYTDGASWLAEKGISLTLDSEWKISGTSTKLTDLSIISNEFTSDTLKDEKYDYLTKGKYARIKIIKDADTYSYHEVTNIDSPKTTGKITFSPAVTDGTYTVELGSGTWSTTIKKATLQGLAGQTKTISAEATDTAGMPVSVPLLATVIVDREYPKVEIGTLGSIINKKVLVTITSSDNTGLRSVQFQYKKHSDLTWTTYQTKLISSNSNLDTWTLELDTEDSRFTDETDYDFRAIATDLADNTGNSGANRTDSGNSILDSRTKSAKISQDSDRPVIKFESWTFQPYEEDSLSKFPLGKTELTFTVEDDDGVDESKVYYQFTGLTVTSVTEDDANWKSKASTGTKLTYDSVNHKYKLSNIDEGEQKIWFKIEDKKGEKFISSSSTNKPKLQDSGNSAEYDSALILRVDSKPPRVDDVKYLRVTNATTYAESDWKEKNAISAEKFGGIAAKYKNKFQISLYAFDENPIKSVKLTIPQVSGDADKAEYEYFFTDTNKDGFNKSTRGLSKKREADSYGLWMTGDIDVSKYKTSKRTCTVTVDDGVNPNSDTTFDLIIDNSGPKLEGAVSPDSTEPIVGTFKIRSALVDKEGDILGVGVDADEVKYYIPKSSETSAADIADTAWKETSSGSLNLTIEISDLNKTIGYDSVSGSVSDDYTAYLSGELYQIPFWIRLKDTYGNVTNDTTSISIRYNPNADKPMISITDPVHDTPTASPAYVIAGGKLKISGTASDNVGIKAVYLQFDMDGDGVYENGVGVTGAPADISLEDIPNKIENGVQLQGVKASGTESWSCSVNILDLTDLNTESKHLKIRAIAVDKGHKTEAEDLCSAWSDVLHVLVDNIKPQFTVPELRRYDSAITSSADADSYSARKDYSKNMYIKTSGQHWYIYSEVLVKDENYISGLVVSGSESGTWTGANGIASASSGDIISWSSDSGKTHKFLIPVTQDNGKTVWETTITAKGKNINDNKNENEDEYKINIDNTASRFSDEYDGNEVDTHGNIKLYKNSYGGNALLPASTGNKTLCNDNANFVTIAGKITEKDSGFDKLLFYFERVSKSQYYMINTGDLALSKASSELTVTDGLPVYSVTSGITRGGEYKVTLSSLPDFVRVGGLIKIGGDYRRITKIDGKEISFDTACPVKFNDKVEFVYAMVIDSNNETLTTTNSTFTLDETDGDGLYEKYKPDGNDYIWEIAVNSKKIPDGPITIHCAVIDKAGNISTGYTKTYISNNPPRITSVYLGTDVNADGKYTFTDSDTTSEFKQFFVKDTETKTEIDVWNLEAKIKSKFWTAKKNLVVIPEFVGGNGDIYYRYSKKTGNAGEKLGVAETGTKDGTTPTLAKLLSSSDSIEGKTLAAIKSDSSNSNGIIILENDLSDPAEDTLGKITTTGDYEKDSNDGVNVYRFSFWDSTEGCTVGSDSQWCVLNITMAQDLYDGTAPYGNITPFYWKGTGNNKSSVVFSGSTPQGHIEFENDLPSTFTADGTGVNDRDPKVSGKIKIEGEAYDETMLKSITVTFDNHSVTATYDSSASEKWTYATNSDDFSLAVTDTNGPTQDGHSVTWVYTVDTSKASKVAKTDVIVNVEVRDASAANSGAGNANTPGTVSTKREDDGTTKRQDKGGNLRGYYKVDVVPYITRVKTGLSGLKSKNPSVFDRTALGHYSVRSDEKVTLVGFNLGNTEIDMSGKSSGSFDDYTVEGVPFLNNKNNDDAKDYFTDMVDLDTTPTGDYEIYKNYYNRQPNGDNNNLLTDDIYFDVWEFRIGAQPVSGKIEQPVMKINPAGDNEIGFAFVDGPLYFSMPSGNNSNTNTDTTSDKNYPIKANTSYTYWMASYDFFTSAGFTYDSLGNAYSVAAGGDINETQADHWDLLTSRWGGGNHNSGGSYDGQHIRTLESIGLLENSTYLFDKQRIKSPSLVTTSASSDTTKLYLAYYDAMKGQIRFRSGNVTASNADGGFVSADFKRTNPADSKGSAYRSLIAGGTGNAGKAAGEYVSIGAIEGGGTSDDLVMAVWYDQRTYTLWYNYTLTPNSNRGKTDGSGWSTPVRVFDSSKDYAKAGEYCQLVVDGNKGVHIAAYDPTNCDLVYAYLPAAKNGKAAATSDFSSCVVDSNGVLGSNLTIDVSLNAAGGTPTPRIGYYATSCIRPKFAYPVGGITTVSPGSDEEAFTQKWECSVVPTENTVDLQSNQYNKMNVGVWKTTAGVAKAPAKTSTSNNQYLTGSGYTSNSYGYAYSNSTGNPIMGYVVKSGANSDFIETAQMK